MRALYLLCTSSLLAGLAMACAANDDVPADSTSGDSGIETLDAGGGDDANNDGGAAHVDAGCTDCTWFPETCAKGALCAVNVDALDPRTVLFAFDVQGDAVTAVGTYGSVVDVASGSWRRTGIGVPDALHGVVTRDGQLWTAGSVASVFIRDTSGSTPTWNEQALDPSFWLPRNWAVNAMFSEPTGSWVWAATATSCAPMAGTDGVGLVRFRKQPDYLELQTVLQLQPPMSQCISMTALDGASGTLWVAGEKGTVYKVTDLEASSPVLAPESTGTTSTILGVWAESTGHVFAVGKDGTVLHRAPGGAFAPLVDDVLPVAYHAVRGTSPSDVWIVGENATVMHYDGQRWTRVPIAGLGARRPTLRAIAAITSDRVWVAGDNVLLGLAREDGRAP